MMGLFGIILNFLTIQHTQLFIFLIVGTKQHQRMQMSIFQVSTVPISGKCLTFWYRNNDLILCTLRVQKLLKYILQISVIFYSTYIQAMIRTIYCKVLSTTNFSLYVEFIKAVKFLFEKIKFLSTFTISESAIILKVFSPK